jgi:hypothetical protein
MPKYLWKASYTPEGARAVAERGGTARRDATAHTLESLGGRLEAFYFAYGETDVYIIGELPDEAGGGVRELGGQRHRSHRLDHDPADRARGGRRERKAVARLPPARRLAELPMDLVNV